jgi:arylformamidase
MTIAGGDQANASELRLDVHTGTHVDAPLHFVDGGENLESVGLLPFVGRAQVVDVPNRSRIGADDLAELPIESGVKRLLLRTNPTGCWFNDPFDPNFAALTADGAQWVVDQGIDLIGIDYLSIQKFDDGPETHQILLRNSVCILEGLDLRAAPAGEYDLVCLPVRLASAEAAPARAILRSLK